MNAKLVILAVFATLFHGIHAELLAQTGSFTVSMCTVNGSEGTYFISSGDRLAFYANTGVAVAAGGPQTLFWQKIWLSDQYGELLASVDDDLVNPAGFGGTDDDLQYTVPFEHEPNIYATSELYYYDGGGNHVNLDWLYEGFNSD